VDLDHSDSNGGPTVVHAKVVDTAHGDRDAALSLGIFDGGQLIWQGRATTVSGNDDVETFYSASSAPSGDPATYDYVLRVDFTT
jgi:hypothetical protein